MVSMQNRAAAEIFRLLDQEERAGDVKIKCSFFEIYGGRCIDLLNGRKRLDLSHLWDSFARGTRCLRRPRLGPSKVSGN